jgi:hypothetical protein
MAKIKTLSDLLNPDNLPNDTVESSFNCKIPKSIHDNMRKIADNVPALDIKTLTKLAFESFGLDDEAKVNKLIEKYNHQN